MASIETNRFRTKGYLRTASSKTRLKRTAISSDDTIQRTWRFDFSRHGWFNVSETIARSRILLLPDGRERISSIEKTLKRYEKCSSTDMVKNTHEKGSPWNMKDSTKKYQIIEDELILERHHIED